MQPKQLLTLGSACALWLVCGCAPSISNLEAHLVASRYADAVAEVTGDPALEAELAALVIERSTAADAASCAELINALAASGSPGRRALSRIAERGEEIPRRLAQIALDRGAPPRAAAERKRFLEHASSDVRAAAAAAWARELDRARLHALLLDLDPRVRRAAVTGLREHTPDREVAAWLRETLRLDPDPLVRAAAARLGEALGGRGKAIDALRGALDDENMGVRLAALRGLGQIGEGEARAMLEDRIVGPLSETVVVAAAELARLGDATGRDRFDEALRSNSAGVRSTALTHLERAGIEQREEALIAALADEAPQVVLLAASLLLHTAAAEPGGPVPRALRRLAEQHGARSDEARDMLAVLGDGDAVAAVAAVLAEGDGAELVAVLSRVRKAAALRARFVSLLAHAELSVRLAAARAVLAASLG
jgi:HEAT repeat protein